MRLNLARVLHRSAANGPGERFVVWVQGCPLACPGCWNPDTWTFARRTLRETDELMAEITATGGIEGVTITGGEPFMQARALADLGQQIRRAGLSLFVFTGYELDELKSPDARALMAAADVLVTGRYVESERTHALPWRGSANQRVHFLTARYSFRDMHQAAAAEIRIGADGTLTLTGFPQAELLTDLRPIPMHRAKPLPAGRG